MTKQETLEAAAKGEGCLGRSKDDEPVFTLVGRDELAAKAIRYWAQLLDAGTLPDSPSRKKAMEARSQASEFDRWRIEHGGKMPD